MTKKDGFRSDNACGRKEWMNGRMDREGFGFFLLAHNHKRTNTCIKMLFINIESETYSNFSQYYRYTFKNDQWVTICTKEEFI